MAFCKRRAILSGGGRPHITTIPSLWGHFIASKLFTLKQYFILLYISMNVLRQAALLHNLAVCTEFKETFTGLRLQLRKVATRRGHYFGVAILCTLCAIVSNRHLNGEGIAFVKVTNSAILHQIRHTERKVVVELVRTASSILELVSDDRVTLVNAYGTGSEQSFWHVSQTRRAA